MTLILDKIKNKWIKFFTGLVLIYVLDFLTNLVMCGFKSIYLKNKEEQSV